MCSMISFHSILSILYWYIRPVIKWFLRCTTNLCELQRICYGEIYGAPRTLAVEISLLRSRSPLLRELPYLQEKRTSMPYRVALQHSIETVIKTKKINKHVHIQFLKSFAKCMEQIWSYLSLVRIMEELRQTPYDCKNSSHEEKLLRLWDLLVPDVKLESRVTKQWQLIGFQGDDPKTDFRGMGILGLENLLFFASEYTNIAQRILVRSQHPKHGYAFAIVGINLTHLTYHLVKDGVAKTHMYNTARSPINIKYFHQLYCYLYVEFDKFWVLSKPNNIMDFSYIRDKFEKNIRENLSNTATRFRINVVVDEVFAAIVSHFSHFSILAITPRQLFWFSLILPLMMYRAVNMDETSGAAKGNFISSSQPKKLTWRNSQNRKMTKMTDIYEHNVEICGIQVEPPNCRCYGSEFESSTTSCYTQG